MKVFVFLAIVALACADGEWKPKTEEELKTIRTECLAAHPLSKEAREHMKNFEYLDVESVRKYILCTATKADIFCTHNGYHPDRIAKQFKFSLDEAEALAIAQGCVDDNVAGSPADVWAFRGHTCLMASKIGDQVKNFVRSKLQAAEH